MKLLTEKHIEQLRKNYEIRIKNDESSPAVVKLFNPCGAGTWYVSELAPDNDTAYGLAHITDNDFGMFSLKELESIKCPPFSLPIERDTSFPENTHTLTECLKMV
tara:strand:- start:1031 stop:1345 length:315 start_codon:yes stop_codon:yes gene_type:complete